MVGQLLGIFSIHGLCLILLLNFMSVTGTINIFLSNFGVLTMETSEQQRSLDAFSSFWLAKNLLGKCLLLVDNKPLFLNEITAPVGQRYVLTVKITGGKI